MTTTTHDAATVVSNFYSTLAAGDPDKVAELVGEHFVADATLVRPESLPGGGTLQGAAKIAKFMRAAASHARGLRLKELHTAPGDGVDHVFAVVEVNFGAPTSAIEWWVIEPGGVRSLTAYYWDTAALTTR
jgi:ketosteroid isomerase-like protein